MRCGGKGQNKVLSFPVKLPWIELIAVVVLVSGNILGGQSWHLGCPCDVILVQPTGQGDICHPTYISLLNCFSSVLIPHSVTIIVTHQLSVLTKRLMLHYTYVMTIIVICQLSDLCNLHCIL